MSSLSPDTDFQRAVEELCKQVETPEVAKILTSVAKFLNATANKGYNDGFNDGAGIKTATVMMPKELTAENCAKAAFIGEFKEKAVFPCPCCIDGVNDGEECEECSGAGSFSISVPISWTNVKAIYKKAVEMFAG